MSYQLNTRKRLQLHFNTTIIDDKKQTKVLESGKRYISFNTCLSLKNAEKLTTLAKKMKVTESEFLRKILDTYFKGIEKNGSAYEPLRKTSPIGMKIIPRTIGREQAIKLRELSRQTGRKMSELVREAVAEFFAG